MEVEIGAARAELRNALEVSYLDDLAFGEFTPARHRAIKDRSPERLRAVSSGMTSTGSKCRPNQATEPLAVCEGHNHREAVAAAELGR